MFEKLVNYQIGIVWCEPEKAYGCSHSVPLGIS
ncbi:hypothetical protein Aazo_2512 ['Nostoc azollae' 0708]|uniref:Uncharacterized protein n=1 Tax=Nostoc azollae (strain 0708) TaxID=551115 RepID=D7DYT2_NOSA0|nr:hypothetical protein Aazo_2512 ['Nostoc azollae' 0708]